MFGKLPFEARKLVTSRAFMSVFLAFFIFSLFLTYAASNPVPTEKYLSLSTLGSNKTTDSYGLRDDSTMIIGETVNWYVNVQNHMGGPEYLALRLKLQNATQEIPNDLTHTSSPVSQVYEIKRMVEDNSTWTIPLEWSVKVVDTDENHTVIKTLNINGVDVDALDARSSDGRDFRMILELWRYDIESKKFTFEWSSNKDERTSWNQIWFNLE